MAGMRGLEGFSAANWRGGGWRPAAVALALAAALVGLTTAAPDAPGAAERGTDPQAPAGGAPAVQRPDAKPTTPWMRATGAHRCGAADYADHRRLIVTPDLEGRRDRLVTFGADCIPPGRPMVVPAQLRYCRLADAPARARRQARAIEAHNQALLKHAGLPGCIALAGEHAFTWRGAAP
jgi:hypothetical protein